MFQSDGSNWLLTAFVNMNSLGSMTVPTLNATSALQVNGSNINTIYAPLTSPTFTGPVIATAVIPQMRCSPNVDGNESSIAFYQYANRSGGAPGNAWTVGHGTNGVGAGNFSIGCSTTGSVVSITSAGVVNIPGSLQVQGTPVALKPWSCGYVAAAGTTVTNQLGLYTNATVSKSQTGYYNITFGAGLPNINYNVFATLQGFVGMINVAIQNTSYVQIRTYNASGVATDANFSYQVIAQ
jgi:hypothetical protein